MIPELRRRPRFGLEMAVVLVVKFAALALIWSLWFADPVAREAVAEHIGNAVYSSAAAPAAPGARHAGP